MTPSYWATTAEETGPTIDKVLDHRPKPDIGMSCQPVDTIWAKLVTELDPYSVQKKDFEYLVSTPNITVVDYTNCNFRSSGKTKLTTIQLGKITVRLRLAKVGAS